MKVLESFEPFTPDASRPLFLTLGNFDGVHRGHQAILKRVMHQAEEKGGQTALITFREHPQAVLHPERKPSLLNTQEHKLFLLEEAGLDICFYLPFTREFSEMGAESFVNEILVKKLQIAKIFLGENARFGKDRAGDTTLMSRLAVKSGFHFEQVASVLIGGDRVSSSRIRTLASKGELEDAQMCLGRPYSIFSEVVHGDGRGAGLGFPTANLKIDVEVIPPDGVYAVQVREITVKSGEASADEKRFQAGSWQAGVLNYGKRPTFHHKRGAPRVAEVFIMEPVLESLYGRHVEVAFTKKIREEKAFPGVEELKLQIAKDIETAREILG